MGTDDSRLPGFCDSLQAMADADSVKQAVGRLVSPTPKSKGAALDYLSEMLGEKSSAQAIAPVLSTVLDALDAQTLRSWVQALGENPLKTKSDNREFLTVFYVRAIIANRKLDAQSAKPRRNSNAEARSSAAHSTSSKQRARGPTQATPAELPSSGAGPVSRSSASAAEVDDEDTYDEGPDIVQVVSDTVVSNLFRAFDDLRSGGGAAGKFRYRVSELDRDDTDGNVYIGATRFEENPQLGKVYVRNPFSESYVTIEKASQRIVEESFAAIQTVCASLGARHIHVLHAYTISGQASMLVEGVVTGHSLGVEAGGSTSKTAGLSSSGELGVLNGPPSVPEDLVWFVDQQPYLLALCRDVMQRGNVLSREIVIENSYGKQIANRLRGLEGIASVSASFSQDLTGRWEVRVDFRSPDNRTTPTSTVQRESSALSPAAALPPSGYNSPQPQFGAPPIGVPAQAYQYYVRYNGQQVGPVGIEQIRNAVQTGQMTKETILWREGLSEWCPARTVPELVVLFAPPPPPFGGFGTPPPYKG